MNRIRLILHRLFRRPAITGPTRIYTRRIPAGTLLDLKHFLTGALNAIADDEELLGLLLEYSADRATSSGHDGHAPEALLLEQILGAVGYEVLVTDRQAAVLADRLRPVESVVWLPEQRRAGDAA